MRTTVDIPERLLRQAKATAALEGTSLKEFFVEALLHEVSRCRPPSVAGHRIQLPLVRSRKPGTLNITNAAVADALAAEDVDVLAGR